MANDKIKCPKCGYEIPVSEVLTHQIREEESAKLDKEYKLKEAAFIQEAKEKASESVKLEMAEKDKKVAEVQKKELALIVDKRKFEEEKKASDLIFAKKMEAGRAKIREEALKQASEEHFLKDKEKDNKIEGLMKMVDELKRKAEQGSTQAQGEVLETSLEETLKAAFPKDDIQPVPKGVRGADVTQKVLSSRGKVCGTIVWESKRTKAWSDGWIDKLKDDQREIGAEIAVIVSETMPKDIANIGMMNGVWVTRYELAVALAVALRQNLIEISFVKSSSVGKDEKMQAIYSYLTGTEFRQKIEAIVETFVRMKTSLDKEKRVFQKIWKEREKQIERLTNNTVGMYGELREVMGASALPEIKTLELAAASDEPLEPEDTEK